MKGLNLNAIKGAAGVCWNATSAVAVNVKNYVSSNPLPVALISGLASSAIGKVSSTYATCIGAGTFVGIKLCHTINRENIKGAINYSARAKNYILTHKITSGVASFFIAKLVLNTSIPTALGIGTGIGAGIYGLSKLYQRRNPPAQPERR